jgi:hypothetical protein
MQHLKYGELKGSDSEENSEPSSPKVHERNQSTDRDFENAFRSIITTNTSAEVVDGISLLIQLA